jgi:hypothetical protein
MYEYVNMYVCMYVCVNLDDYMHSIELSKNRVEYRYAHGKRNLHAYCTFSEGPRLRKMKPPRIERIERIEHPTLYTYVHAYIHTCMHAYIYIQIMQNKT